MENQKEIMKRLQLRVNVMLRGRNWWIISGVFTTRGCCSFDETSHGRIEGWRVGKLS
jgi:hypothetical protein